MLHCLRSVYGAGAGSLTATAGLATATAPATASSLATAAGVGQLSKAGVVGGIGALYRGAYPSVLRALPSYAASFWGYEKTLELIERWKEGASRRGGVQGKGGSGSGDRGNRMIVNEKKSQ